MGMVGLQDFNISSEHAQCESYVVRLPVEYYILHLIISMSSIVHSTQNLRIFLRYPSIRVVWFHLVSKIKII